MKIIFMGSPQFAVASLAALKESQHEIVAVVTQPDRPSGRMLQSQAPAVKVAAHKFALPVLQPVTTKTPQFVEEIASFQPDLLVVVAYGEILRQNLLESARCGAVNLHASLLPKYRGAAPIPWAILKGEAKTGATTIYMNEVMDGGPILLQESCPISSTDTSQTLSKKISALGAPLLRRTLDLIEKNEITPVEQELNSVTYAPKLKKEDGWIDWNQSAIWISRQIRAFDPWPGTFSDWEGIQVKFWLASPEETEAKASSGTVIEASKQGLLVVCGEGSVLRVLEVQPQNRPRLTAGDFISGYRIRRGARFMSRPNLNNL